MINENFPRKKREVYGPNFKWNTNSNMCVWPSKSESRGHLKMRV